MTTNADNAYGPVPATEALALKLNKGLGPQSRSALMGPLAYGTCQSLEMARCAADEALREGLRGQFPASCVVLDMHVARLEAAIKDVLQWEAKRMGAVSAAALRDVLRA